MAKQLQIDSVIDHSFKTRQKKIARYVKDNKEKYRQFASNISPDLSDPWQIWDRIAFSILSANCSFEQAVRALAYATKCKGNCESEVLIKFGMVPRKAEYLNKLPIGAEIFRLLKSDSEDWNQYRLRLKSEVLGLGLAKSSFTACLLYPLTADLGCIDTHICKVYLGVQAFTQLGIKNYLLVESKIRAIAKRAGINTFLAQWLIWDHTRGVQMDHDIFPGAHKEK
jgi:thermostable 8-oxoguanine DNA glycosylase